MDRRRFLTNTGKFAAAAVAAPSLMQTLAARGGGTANNPSSLKVNFNKGGTITILSSFAFVPVADQVHQTQMDAWASQHKGWKVVQDLVSGDVLQEKITAVVEAGSGPDVLGLSQNQPLLYAGSLADHTSYVKEIIKKNGPFYDYVKANSVVNGKWKLVPTNVSPSTWVYRKDLWTLVGKPDFVTTYADMLKYGSQLVKQPKGLPVGIALGNASGDSQGSWYPVLWSFGGQEVEKDGKTVAIESNKTRAALEWAVEMYNSGALWQKVVAWASGASNNLAWAGETISATTNGSSIYVNSKAGGPNANPPEYAATGAIAVIHGPKRGVALQSGGGYGITSWSKNKNAAGELLAYLMHKDNYTEWVSKDGGALFYPGHFLDDLPLWKQNPVLDAFNKSCAFSLWPGWPGPPNRASANVYDQYLIVQMFARAVQDPKNLKNIMSSTAQQLTQIYNRPS